MTSSLAPKSNVQGKSECITTTEVDGESAPEHSPSSVWVDSSHSLREIETWCEEASNIRGLSIDHQAVLQTRCLDNPGYRIV